MHPFLQRISLKARRNAATIVLAEAEDPRVITAAAAIERQKLANLILLGRPGIIERQARSLKKTLKSPIIDPAGYGKTLAADLMLVEKLVEARKEKGMTPKEAERLLLDTRYYAAMLVKERVAAAFVSGNMSPTVETLRPALQLLKSGKRAFSYFIMLKAGREPLFFADCGMTVDPSVEELASIAAGTADVARALGVKPRVALLSYSTLGSAGGAGAEKVRAATALARQFAPGTEFDGELQLDAAIVPDVARRKAPRSKVAGNANVLIFPDLGAGNIGYKLMERFGGYQAIGPLLANVPAHDMSRGCSPDDIVAVVAIAAAEARR